MNTAVRAMCLGGVIWLQQRVTKGGEPKLTLEALGQKDLDFLNITEHNPLDIAQQRKGIHVADPINGDLKLDLVWYAMKNQYDKLIKGGLL